MSEGTYGKGKEWGGRSARLGSKWLGENDTMSCGRKSVGILESAARFGGQYR